MMTTSDDQQPIGHIVGRRKKTEISPHADGESLREAALFGAGLQKLGAVFRFPYGVYRYKTHDEANRHWLECMVDNVVATQEKRRGR